VIVKDANRQSQSSLSLSTIGLTVAALRRLADRVEPRRVNTSVPAAS
jgi:hypothetical protein